MSAGLDGNVKALYTITVADGWQFIILIRLAGSTPHEKNFIPIFSLFNCYDFAGLSAPAGSRS